MQFAQRIGSRAAIEYPKRHEIESIEPRSGPCQSAPDRITGFVPEQPANGSGEKTCQRAGQAHGSARLQADAQCLPSYVRTQAGQKHRHIGGKASALDIDEVAHFMQKNQHSEADPEFPSKSSPVESDEGGKAKQKFEFENRKKESLEFGEKKSDRRQWAKPSYPSGFGVWRFRRDILRRSWRFQLTEMITDPLGLL